MKHLAIASRRLLGGIVAGLVLLSSGAGAAPVQPTDQVAGYYRQQVGGAVVTALYDGYVDISSKLLKGIQGKDLQALMARMFVQDRNGVQTAVNGFLVHTGDRLVLVDTGSSSCFGPTMGNLQGNIQAAGYKPEDIDTVLLTHMHPDHICGLLTKDGKPAFPNAQVWAAQADADYWLSDKAAAQASEDTRPFFKMAKDAIAPYQSKGAFHTFTKEAKLPDGFSVVPSPGHTPGHSSYLLTSGSQRLLIWGDIIHSHPVQLARPEVSIEFDSDQKQAIQSRKAILQQAAQQGWLIAGAHLPFPGLGHIRKDGRQYSWVPVEFSPLRRDR